MREKLTRRRYTLEYKQEAVRLVSSGQSVAAAAKALGIVEQTLENWVKAEKAVQLRGITSEQVSEERMENNRLRAELPRVTMERDNIGKSHGVLREGAAMKYAWIEQNKLRWPVCVQCRVLGVSASGYRQHRARKKKILTRRHPSEIALLVEIRAVYTEARGTYGWPSVSTPASKSACRGPRVWRQLKASGVRVGKHRVELAMRQNGIRARGKRPLRVSTTDSNRALPIAPNLLARNFTVAAANTVWAGDMTYIPTGEGWLYLAMVLDLFSRHIVGWSMGEAIDSELACRALDMEWCSRLPAPGLIFHGDPGSQYRGPRRPILVAGVELFATRCYTNLLAGHERNALRRVHWRFRNKLGVSISSCCRHRRMPRCLRFVSRPTGQYVK